MNSFFALARRRMPKPATGTDAGSAAQPLRAPDGVRFIAGEDVLLISVSLPQLSTPRRRIAAAFAVEEYIAQPLDEVLVALGPELSPNRWLVGVVARAAMPTDRQPGQRILPDTLGVPVPPPGAWAVWEADDRVLVRLPDSTGFATCNRDLALLHATADHPEITLYGGRIDLDHTPGILPPISLPVRFDLAERTGGAFAVPLLGRRLIAIAALTAAAHLALVAADVLSLSRQQSTLATQLRAAAGAPASTEIDDLLTRILAPGPAAEDAGFLPLLGAAFAALSDQSDSFSLADLRYAAARNSLALTFLAADLGTLQRVEAELVTAGFSVDAGPATSADGSAEQQMTLFRPPS